MKKDNSSSKMRAAGGRESKVCEEMEKKGFDQRPEEAQISTINHLFQILRDDGQNSWLYIYVCGWQRRSIQRRKMVWMNIESD